MQDAPEFQPYGLPHLTVIFLTIVLPFALAAIVQRTRSQRLEKVIIGMLSAVLLVNYIVYLLLISSKGWLAGCQLCRFKCSTGALALGMWRWGREARGGLEWHSFGGLGATCKAC